MQASFVEAHAFSPLIHYVKQTKRYKREKSKTERKDRHIMYASHRDACILSFYASHLNSLLDTFYQDNHLDENVIAYRALGRSNYDFSASAYQYAIDHAPCAILAFDVSGFFDNLDHALLKTRLKRILNTSSLPEDWHRVFRFSTKFHFVELSDLKAHPPFAEALRKRGTNPIASIAELKAVGIPFLPNPKDTVGIPQGTPISATLSNLYMIDFDINARAYCESIDAFYRRYSDDILVICSCDRASEVEARIADLIAAEKLELSKSKTEVTIFNPSSPSTRGKRCAQYLGFAYYPDGPGIRPSSLSARWRKMRRAIKRTERAGAAAIAGGKATKVYTKKLRRRFSPLPVRNFSSYARRSASAFGVGQKITAQVKRFEREFARLINDLVKAP